VREIRILKSLSVYLKLTIKTNKMSKSNSKLKVETLKLWLNDLKKNAKTKTHKTYEKTSTPTYSKR